MKPFACLMFPPRKRLKYALPFIFSIKHLLFSLPMWLSPIIPIFRTLLAAPTYFWLPVHFFYFWSTNLFDIQWTLSISTTLYLELLSISNNKLGPLDICVLSKLFLSLYLELLYLEFFSISNKNLGPLRLFLSLSRTFSRLRVHLHSK